LSSYGKGHFIFIPVGQHKQARPCLPVSHVTPRKTLPYFCWTGNAGNRPWLAVAWKGSGLEGIAGMDEDLKKIIHTLIQEKDPLKKSLGVLAVITKALKPVGIKPILVGGRALEFYTLGGYATKDIDLVINGREQAKVVLTAMGFLQRPGERHWYHEELDVALEIPDEYLAGSLDKLFIVEINGMEAFIIGIEDLIIDRLAAAKFWKSPGDAQWAAKLLALHAQEIDMKYLEKTARKEQVEDILVEVIKQSKVYLGMI